MKKTILTVAAVSLLTASMLTTPSCIGSFSLTNRLLGWNQNVGNKFLNELVFFAFWVLPVYEVTCVADLLVLNSIEFWSGTNPMAKGERLIEGNDGKYLVRCDGKGYDIESLSDGSAIRLDFDAEEQSWSYEVNGERTLLFTFVDDTHVKLPVDGGKEFRTVEISESGLYAYQQMVQPALYAAR
ncbi:MAG: DUF3332 domain-containing protein [Muribaculaceae bacterium]|nr:DUF3332 domain-containing protein [Muribaculaceae bacterium]